MDLNKLIIKWYYSCRVYWLQYHPLQSFLFDPTLYMQRVYSLFWNSLNYSGIVFLTLVESDEFKEILNKNREPLIELKVKLFPTYCLHLGGVLCQLWKLHSSMRPRILCSHHSPEVRLQQWHNLISQRNIDSCLDIYICELTVFHSYKKKGKRGDINWNIR